MTGSRASACLRNSLDPESWRHTTTPSSSTRQRREPHATFSSALNSVHQAAPASRTYGRYAVGPNGPILDPDASTWCAQNLPEEQQRTRTSPLTRPRSFRDDPGRAVVPMSESWSGVLSDRRGMGHASRRIEFLTDPNARHVWPLRSFMDSLGRSEGELAQVARYLPEPSNRVERVCVILHSQKPPRNGVFDSSK